MIGELFGANFGDKIGDNDLGKLFRSANVTKVVIRHLIIQWHQML